MQNIYKKSLTVPHLILKGSVIFQNSVPKMPVYPTLEQFYKNNYILFTLSDLAYQSKAILLFDLLLIFD